MSLLEHSPCRCSFGVVLTILVVLISSTCPRLGHAAGGGPSVDSYLMAAVRYYNSNGDSALAEFHQGRWQPTPTQEDIVRAAREMSSDSGFAAWLGKFKESNPKKYAMIDALSKREPLKFIRIVERMMGRSFLKSVPDLPVHVASVQSNTFVAISTAPGLKGRPGVIEKIRDLNGKNYYKNILDRARGGFSGSVSVLVKGENGPDKLLLSYRSLPLQNLVFFAGKFL